MDLSHAPVVDGHCHPWRNEDLLAADPAGFEDRVTMPWASLAVDQKLELLLGAAPPAKVLHGSDEASEPEVIWLAAQLAREALGPVPGTAVERAWLTEREAVRIGEGVLAGNARRLHGLGV